MKSKNLPNGVESTYTYDKNGWLTQREETSSGVPKQTYSYEYDKNGNLTKLTDPTGESISYTYDADGKLKKEVQKEKKINYRCSGSHLK